MDTSKIHELKIDSSYFEQLIKSDINYQIRKNDREYNVGDTLILKETVFTGEEMSVGHILQYTGNSCVCKVTDVRTSIGLAHNYVILHLDVEYVDLIKK